MHKFTGKFAHVGFAIGDLEQTILELKRILDGDSFQIIDEVDTTDFDYLGAQTDPELRVGIGTLSGLPVELIEQSNEAPSPYYDDIRKGLERPHHLAFTSSNYDLDKTYLEQQGGEIIFSCDKSGSTFSYFRFERLPGLVIELMEINAE